MLVAVDLAALYSAACIMDSYNNVIDRADSWKLNQDAFLNWITKPWRDGWNEYPDVLIIEDLPARVPFMTNTKNVCRLQGRIEEKMRLMDCQEYLLFVPPSVWQKSFGITTAKGAAKLVQPKAEELGFTPFYDYTKYHGTDRATARKSNTDHAAAYLIGRWANDYYKTNNTYDAPRTSRL